MRIYLSGFRRVYRLGFGCFDVWGGVLMATIESAHYHAAELERQLIILGYPAADIKKSVSIWVDLLRYDFELTKENNYERIGENHG